MEEVGYRAWQFAVPAGMMVSGVGWWSWLVGLVGRVEEVKVGRWQQWVSAVVR